MYLDHWKGGIEGMNWWWPPHGLVCGLTTEAALATTRLAETQSHIDGMGVGGAGISCDVGVGLQTSWSPHFQ